MEIYFLVLIAIIAVPLTQILMIEWPQVAFTKRKKTTASH
jgi:hypothetical protein